MAKFRMGFWQRSGWWFVIYFLVNAPVRGGDFKFSVKEHTVPTNGMKFLVVENHTAPVFATYLRFKVGSVDERPGITGTSHLLEHMMFKGTKQVGTTDFQAEKILMDRLDSVAHLLRAEQMKLQMPLSPADSARLKELRELLRQLQAEQKKYIIKDELWETYLRNGGSGLNASTGNDGTQYFVSLPANRLELWMFLESDRIANPVLREFYSERDVVYEERRLRTDTQPWGKMYEQFAATAFTAHPYGWPVVGWASDLETVTREEVEQYFRRYYAPNNAVAVIVGDVKPEEVFWLADKYFGPIPAQPPPDPVFTQEPPQEGERRVKVEFDANPLLLIGWHMPAIGHPDQLVLDVVSSILSGGRTSRLYKRIVEEKKLATRITASSSQSRYPDIFDIQATPLTSRLDVVDSLEQAIYIEIDSLKKTPVSEWELQKVRNQIDAQQIRQLQSNFGLAFAIGNMQALTGDWRNMIEFADQRKAVTAEDILRVMNQYFTESNRTVAVLVKTPGKQVIRPTIDPAQLRH